MRSKNPNTLANNEFDSFAGRYDEALARGISLSGESKDFFSQGRIKWLLRCLNHLDFSPRTILDYGCGTGSAIPYFLELLNPESIVGLDISLESLRIARQNVSDPRVQFLLFNEYSPGKKTDLAFCNGVFHHVLPNERSKVVDYVFRTLRPKGIFSFWENNSWNPGARLVMRRIPFDRDAVPISPIQAVRLLRASGFEVLSVHFLFIFPRALRTLRWIEPLVARLPSGAQYQVLAKKPG
ncbi:MAG: class I SAM-dependent methyltransferase [Pseudomonadota bacterium]